jgi:SAM-dependent methyltransferase
MAEATFNRQAVRVGRLQQIGRGGLLVPPREDADELLDLGVGEPQEVSDSLDDLWRLNRFLGGLRAVTTHLYTRLDLLAEPATVIDIGAGDGRVAASIAGWAVRNRHDVRVVALDLSQRHLKRATPHAAAAPNLSLLQADAMKLPFAPGTTDYFVSSLVLHHFAPEQAVGLLRSAWRSARRGLVIADLMRGHLPLIGFKLAQPVFARSPITRYDGVVSIRRGYTPDELRLLAYEAGIPHPRVFVHPFWRMTLVADK